MTPQRLRELYGAPTARAANKVITSFDEHCRQIIDHATFIIIATSDGKNLDISPKGDPAGFVTVETDNSILIPDRPGNNRIDGLMNMLLHPNVAILFMIPSVTETLRVNGTAEISDDPTLCAQFQINKRSPKTVTRVNVTEIYTHCGKAPLRAGLWQPDTWPATRPIPTLYEIVRDHSQIPTDSVTQEAVDEDYRSTLY